MIFSLEGIISILAVVLALLILVFLIDWRYFRDWIVVLLFKMNIDFIWGSPVVNLKLIDYPVRLLPHYYNTCILFELWVFPILCVWYNQVTKDKSLLPIIGYALLFSAGITMIEYPIERYTRLIEYLQWRWFTTFYTLTITFLMSRAFIAFYRWGCNYFSRK